MNPLARILRWLRPIGDPEAEAEAQRILAEQETVKTSQLGNKLGTGNVNIPPAPDVLDPKKR
jgi:hypothetical protein